MTLETAVSRLRTLLHEPVPKFWSDADLERWLDDGQRAMCSRRGIEEIWTDTLAGETSVVVPMDLHSVYKVYINGEKIERGDYEIFHNSIHFKEAKTGDLEVWGWRSPTPVVDDDDEFELPEHYMDGVLAYAMMQANMENENYPEAQFYNQVFAEWQARWEVSENTARSHFGE